MSTVTNEKRSLDEWLVLITKARQSGLSDAEWCRRNGINRYTFHSAVKRLRRRACHIPQSTLAPEIAPPAPKQDVVQISVLPDDACYGMKQDPTNMGLAPATESSPIEIASGDVYIKIANHANPAVITAIVSALRRLP